MDTIGKRLKEARTATGMSQKELHEKSGVSQQMISKLESGKASATSSVVQLARALGVDPGWLVDGTVPTASHVGPAIPADRPIPSSFRSEPEAPQEPGREAAPLPSSASSSALPDLATLLGAASPRSRTAMERIAEAAKDGRLTEDDLELLAQIAARIEGRKG